MRTKHVLISLGIISLLVVGSRIVFAENETEAELSQLQQELATRKSQIDTITKKMESYRKQIAELSNKSASLVNDIAYIENQIALAELDLELTEAEIETQELELAVLEERVRQESVELENQRLLLKDLLFNLYKSSDVGAVEILFGARTMNELFDEVERMENLNGSVQLAVNQSKTLKAELEKNQLDQERALEALVLLRADLESQRANLEHRLTAKNILVEETQQSEAQYRVLLGELRSEQQGITSQISSLQQEIEDRLRNKKEEDPSSSTGHSLPSGMVHPLPGAVLTATFNDPTYPFRHLFEHSGMDLARPSGTPILAAGDGIVAWTRTGKSYGNYVMIIHDGGYATLYAHMSGFAVSADDYVRAGEVIGYVGTTGFSTGPHLHFELRANGIPVNPAQYIPALR